MRHPSTPANPARLVSAAMNLRQHYSANELGQMQQQRRAQGKQPSVVLQHAQGFALLYPVK